MTPAEMLKAICKQIDLPLTELARRAGLPYSKIYDLVNGRNKKPSHETVVRVIRALRMSGLSNITSSDIWPVPVVIERPPDHSEDYA